MKTEKIRILDHGYLRLIEAWGSDQSIIEAARMSTDGGFVSWEPYEGHPKGDEGLLAYLWNNKHATPFEMAGMTVEVQAPIFVFREWHRHRTQSYNEMSARYMPLPDQNYMPTIERLMVVGGHLTKQAAGVKGAPELSEKASRAFLAVLYERYQNAQKLYTDALEGGIPKELARVILPVGRYSRMRASANLRNWLAFLTLRTDRKAQWEIQQYANAVAEIVREQFPRTYKLWAGGNQAVKIPNDDRHRNRMSNNRGDAVLSTKDAKAVRRRTTARLDRSNGKPPRRTARIRSGADTGAETLQLPTRVTER